MGIKKTAKHIITWLYDYDKVRKFNRKAAKIISLQAAANAWIKPSGEETVSHVDFWKPMVKNVNTDWLLIYGNISGLFDPHFVPESVYYTLMEPCLNNKAFAKGYNDKNYYSLLIDKSLLPETYLSNIEGELYDSNRKYLGTEDAILMILRRASFVIKPAVDSGGGRDVSLWHLRGEVFVSDNDDRLTVEEILHRYGKNYIIQEVLDQHPFYERYNHSSVNTVRIVTYRSVADNKVHVINMVFRVGALGKITDNQASGGFACGITSDGCLNGKAVDKNGNVYTSVNGVELESGLKLEGIDQMISVATENATRFCYSRILGFDLCIDTKGKVRIIEINNINLEINFLQMLNGPLFGVFSEEVRDYCVMKPRSFIIDFDV